MEGRGFWLTLGFRIEAVFYDLIMGLVRALPVDAASDFGGWVGRTLGPLTPTQRTVETNLDLAFPDMPAEARERLIREQWEQTGRTFAEFPILDRIMADPSRLEVINAERLEEIRDSGRPVVFVSGHFANWEVMPATIVKWGVPCEMTYRAANNPFIDDRIRASRAAYGVKLFAPKGEDGARELLQGMKEGHSVALMNDQKFNRGLAAPFFGHDAFTAPGPTRLAQKFDTVLQPMSITRTNKARFRVVVHEPIPIPKTGDRAKDVEAGVRAITQWIENRVRESPKDWFWVHRRWPGEIYKKRK
jgi:KDO2-lipid IV(A) lauroyltransferase